MAFLFPSGRGGIKGERKRNGIKIKAIVLLLLLEEDNDSYMYVGCTLAWRRLERLPAGTDAERRR